MGRITEDCRVWSQGITGSRSHLGAHRPAIPQSWMGRLPTARSSSPATSRPQSGEGEGCGSIWVCPRVTGVSTLGSAQGQPPSLLPPFPSSPPSLHSLLCVKSSSISHLPPHLLYYFHNLPSLKLQFVCLLWAVVEVHFAPSLGTLRVDGVT